MRDLLEVKLKNYQEEQEILILSANLDAFTTLELLDNFHVYTEIPDLSMLFDKYTKKFKELHPELVHWKRDLGILSSHPAYEKIITAFDILLILEEWEWDKILVCSIPGTEYKLEVDKKELKAHLWDFCLENNCVKFKKS